MLKVFKERETEQNRVKKRQRQQQALVWPSLSLPLWDFGQWWVDEGVFGFCFLLSASLAFLQVRNRKKYRKVPIIVVLL